MSCFLSQFLYDLTHAAGTAPVKGAVETWISRIGAKLGIVIQYSQRVRHVLVRRANHLRDNMKKVTGEAQRRFFQASWKLALLKEVKTTQEIANEARQLRDDKTHLEENLKERKTELVEQATQNEELQRELSQLKEQRSQAVKK